MIVCLFVWLWAGCVGWLLGRAALRGLATVFAPGTPLPWPVVTLVGLAIATALAAAGSLIGPVGPAVAIAMTAVAVILGALVRRSAAPAPESRSMLAPALLGALAALLALVQAVQPIAVFDTGSYHLQAIRWVQRYGAVPGLANLHFRFAFGDAWSVAQALFDPSQLVGVTGCVLGGFVFAAAALYFAAGLRDVRPDSPATALRLAPLLRVASLPAAFWLFRRSLPSASPDAVAALLAWIAMLLAVEKAEDGTAEELDARAVTIAVLAAFAAEVKLATAPLLLLPAWSIARNLRRDTRRALALLALTAAVLAPFLARSWVATGYVQFPIAATRLPLADWTVPAGETAATTWLIAGAARDASFETHGPLAMSRWVPPWWRERVTPVEKGFLIAIPLLALANLALARLRRRRGERIVTPGLGIVAFTALAGSLLWFASAPDPRFGWAFFPFLALLLAASLAAAPLRRRPAGFAALLLLLVLADQARRLAPTAELHLLRPAPFPAIATNAVPLGAYTVRVPASGVQCWDAPPPCAPAVSLALAPRGESPGAGFRVRPTAPGPVKR